MIFLGIINILLLSGSAFLFTYLYFRYHQPSNGQIDADIAKLASLLDQPAYHLAPWDPHEMELLCSLPYLIKKQRGWKDLKTGLLKTIYNEPVASWAAYNYKSQKANALIVCKISGWSQVLVLRIKHKQGLVFRNLNHIATINPDWTIIKPQHNESLGRLITIPDTSHFEFYIHDRKLAVLDKPGMSNRLKPKAFVWLSAVSETDADWIQAISALWLIQQHSGYTLDQEPT